MSELSSRVAARWITALDKAMAVSASDAVRDLIDDSGAGVSWDWNVRDADPSVAFGWSGSQFSFPGKPDEFPSAGILGGALIKGNVEGSAAPGTSFILTLEVGYFHKAPGGEGKYSRATPMGTYEASVSEDGLFSFSDGQNLSGVAAGYRALVDNVLGDPDPTALSKAMSPEEKRERGRVLRDDRAERSRQDRADALNARQKELDRQKLEELEADRATHGTPAAFFDHIVDETGGEFGPGDLNRVLQVMFPTEKERWENRDRVKKEILDTGLTFVPSKTTVSSSPSYVAGFLRLVAGLVESSDRPSASRTASALRELLASLT